MNDTSPDRLVYAHSLLMMKLSDALAVPPHRRTGINVRVFIGDHEIHSLSSVQYVPPWTPAAWARRPWRFLTTRERRRYFAQLRAYNIRCLRTWRELPP